MKPALVLLIIITLFSFITAEVVCGYDLKIICTETRINTCRCAPKDAGGNYAISHSCNKPQKPLCEENSRIVNCRCII